MFHTIIIAGNLGKDPEMRYTPSGKAVTSFSVASSRKYSGQNGQIVEETIWFRITTWDKTAETCSQYLKKGSKVLVEGRLVPDLATGGPKVFARKDGTSGASYEVSAQTVRFLSPKGGEGGQAGPEEHTEISEGGEEIPF